MNEKLLITGGNGFIGRYLCRECNKHGIDFLVLSQDGTCAQRGGTGFPANLLDARSLDRAIEYFQPHAVIHLAAIASPVHQNIAEVYNVNVVGTENLLNAAQKRLPAGSRVIVASTAGVYGNQPVSHLSEDMPFNPVNHYSYSKMVMEFLSRQYADALDINIIRPFNIIGRGQKENFFISKLIKHFSQRAPEIFLGNLKAVRDYVSVELCAKTVLDLAVSQEPIPPVLNICSGTGHSCEDVVHILEELTGHHPKIHSTADLSRPNEIWRLVGDPSRLKSVIHGKYSIDPLEAILTGMLT